jgi:UTP--glucose-1-phosphate uridylyltransferase
MIQKVRRAIIPVAGLGTRMLPATKAIPKELLPIFDRPIIEHVVKEAISGGITEIIFVTRSGKEAIENHFDANYELEYRLAKKGKEVILGAVKNIIPEEVTVTSIRQNGALGLGHAILCAKHLLYGEPFAILLPDVMVLDQVSRDINHSFTSLLNAWDATGVGQIMVERVAASAAEDYGIVDLDGRLATPFSSFKIKGLIEKPSLSEAPSDLAIIGRYILPSIVLDFLESTKMGVGGEIQLTDALDALLQTDDLNAFLTDALTFDCGNKQGFLGANLALGMRDSDTRQYLISLLKNDLGFNLPLSGP